MLMITVTQRLHKRKDEAEKLSGTVFRKNYRYCSPMPLFGFMTTIQLPNGGRTRSGRHIVDCGNYFRRKD